MLFYGKQLTFNPKNHRYYWDGEPLPSVTTIISRLAKPLLIQWAANCAVEHIRAQLDLRNVVGLPPQEGAAAFEAICEEAKKAHAGIRDEAGDVGRTVHDIARAILAGETVFDGRPRDLAPQAVMALVAFERWRAPRKIEPFGLERRIMSRRLRYAGTADFWGLVDGTHTVLDFKTGNGVYDEAWWQTSGYEYALREELGFAGPIRRVIVHLNKSTGECEVHERDSPKDREADGNVWLSLVALDTCLRLARRHKPPRTTLGKPIGAL